MRRTSCSACGSTQLDKFLDLGTSPVADAYAATVKESVALPRHPLEVAVCGKCRLVQLLEVLPQEQLFGTGYSFYSSASGPLSDYHRLYAGEVLERAGQHDFVLEVGCNDGDMLRHFAAAGHEVLGVDPAIGPVTVARERGLDVRVRPFSHMFAVDLAAARGPANIIIANHVLAHVADVHDFLCGIARMLDREGTAYVEVQYLPDLLVNNAFDLVYHEHRNFFSFTSLESAVGRVGLHITSARFTQRQGGSLRVTLRHRPEGDGFLNIRKDEIWLHSDGAYEGTQGRADRIRWRLADELFHLTTTHRVIAGYGAPAKATTLLNFIQYAPEWIVDTTVAKQGRYVPGTRAKIITPGTSYPDVYLVLAWNYLGEIMRNERAFEGKWLVPVPAPVLL